MKHGGPSIRAFKGAILPLWLVALLTAGVLLVAACSGSEGPGGPGGPAGQAGAQGPAGPEGSQGTAGLQGEQGPAGATGAMGPAGPQGEQGPAGATGAMGPAGPKGMSMMTESSMMTEHGDQVMVTLSITNLMRGQILSPVFIARHGQDADPLYTLGQPASTSLAKLAKDADASGLLTDWSPEGNDAISEAMFVALNGGPIMPGATVTMSFEVTDGNSLVSFASMLVTTNDAFIGASGLDVSTSRTVNLNAYDAGSEANSESCAYIPGPPCGNHADDEAEAEGHIYVHAGIHGGEGSDLDPAMHDWRNPVARLTIVAEEIGG